VQGTLDGTNWVSEGAAITTASTTLVEVKPIYKLMRVVLSGYTTGNLPSVYMSGMGNRQMTA